MSDFYDLIPNIYEHIKIYYVVVIRTQYKTQVDLEI